MKPFIKIDKVSKSFQTGERTFLALKDIDLQFAKGEYVAIVGKSGSGKSTLLNLITGIDKQTSGQILFEGQAIDSMNESKLAKWRGANVGIVFQFFQLIPTLSIAENLMIAMEFVAVIPKSARKRRIDEVLASLDIAEQANKMPSALSGGQQQRAAIARALINNPQLIVADEPTGNLDSKNAQAINLLLKGLAKKGKTVLVVTHDDSTKAQYDRVVTLLDGEIVEG